MKQNFMKKALAVALSSAMALSLSTAMNLTSASAATALKVTRPKTMTVGEAAKVTINQDSPRGWKIKSVKTDNKAIVNAAKKTAYRVRLKANAEGTAKITLTLRASNAKLKNRKFKVTVNPVGGSGDDTNIQTNATVSTQAELNAALSDSNIKAIAINDAEGTLTIDDGTYDIDLTVNAPNATIENYGKFNSITINAISNNSWVEKAKGNILNIAATTGRFVIDQSAETDAVRFTGANANLTLVITGTAKEVVFNGTNAKADVTANGTVGKVAVNVQAELDVKGSATVPVDVAAGAKDTTIKSEAKLEVTTAAPVDLQLTKGAEGTTVKVTEDNVAAKIKNDTDQAVEVTKKDNTTESVPAGKETTTTATTPSSTGDQTLPTPDNQGGTSTSSSNVVKVDGIKIADAKITTGSTVITTTAGAYENATPGVIEFDLSDIKTTASMVSGSSIIKYTVATQSADPDFSVISDSYELPNGATTAHISAEYKGSKNLVVTVNFTVYTDGKAGTTKSVIYTFGANLLTATPEDQTISPVYTSCL